MVRHALALLILPVAGLLGQGPVQVRVSAANNAAFRIIEVRSDSSAAPSNGPIIARGTALLNPTALGTITITAVDSVSRIRLEASENGRLVATAEGPYVAVRRDTSGHVMVEAGARIPPEPFAFSRRRPLGTRP